MVSKTKNAFIKTLSMLLAFTMVLTLFGCDTKKRSHNRDDEKNSILHEQEENINSFENDFVSSDETNNNSAIIGSCITFGKYEQDNNTSNGTEDIEWIVLATEGNKAFVISRFALDFKVFHETDTDSGITWETCTLRAWLNNDFYNTAFSDYEKPKISLVTVKADPNPDFGTDSGNDTQDKVFLLSVNEANELLAETNELECIVTDYSNEQSGDTYHHEVCWWWLRTIGGNQSSAASVCHDIDTEGSDAYFARCGVRPAMWIEL